MPDKPTWYSRIDAVIAQLEALPSPWVHRSDLEVLLGVGRRRAQQILRPLVSEIIGKNGLAARADVVSHLRRLAAGETVTYERQRRDRLRSILDELHRQSKEQPRILVEAPTAIVNQEFDALPSGVQLEAGRITVVFDEPQQALEKLLALAMAISNDFDRFERSVGR